MFEHFVLVELDFQNIYHIDLVDVWAQRTWRWFEVRVAGLVASKESLLHYALTDQEGPTDG